MPNATLTSQGQLTLPKAIRDLLGLKAGDQVAFRVMEGQTVVVEPAPQPVDVRSLRGLVKPRRRGVSLEDMGEAVRKAVAAKYRKR